MVYSLLDPNTPRQNWILRGILIFGCILFLYKMAKYENPSISNHIVNNGSRLRKAIIKPNVVNTSKSQNFHLDSETTRNISMGFPLKFLLNLTSSKVNQYLNSQIFKMNISHQVSCRKWKINISRIVKLSTLLPLKV